jgi:hypothetical protein
MWLICYEVGNGTEVIYVEGGDGGLFVRDYLSDGVWFIQDVGNSVSLLWHGHHSF